MTPRSPADLARAVREAGRGLGFVAVGFTTAAPFPRDAAALDGWRAKGHHGEMGYLVEPANRTTPRELLLDAQTVISVALPYSRGDASPAARHEEATNREATLRGEVARYAQGRDYHAVLKARLRTLADRIAELGGPLLARVCVDTAPLTEHAVAERAGVGFVGRNTLSIVPRVGSYVVLGELLVSLALPPDEPIAPRCGRCTRCIDACPTRALAAPYELDARRCIAYLTIELRGSIPRELRAAMGNHVFGCDVCQEVCPYNRPRQAIPPDLELAPRPSLESILLEAHLTAGSAEHRRLTRGTALERVSRPRLARNAAVALGNSGEPRAVESLSRALLEHSSALVRGHVAWALGRLVATQTVQGARAEAVRALLKEAGGDGADPFVRDECAAALAEVWGDSLDPAEYPA